MKLIDYNNNSYNQFIVKTIKVLKELQLNDIDNKLIIIIIN